MRISRVGVPVLLTVAMAVGGCSSGEEPAPAAAQAPAAPAVPVSPVTTSGSPAPELVSWIDRVCAATRLFDKKPAVPETDSDVRSSPDSQAMAWLEQASYVNGIPDYTQASIELLDGLGPEPVGGAAAVVAGYRSALHRLLPQVEKYRTENTGPEARPRVREVAGYVAALKTDGPDLAGLLARTPALAQAHGKAVNCGPNGKFPRPGEGVPR